MERAVALKKLGKLLGSKLGYRINTKLQHQKNVLLQRRNYLRQSKRGTNLKKSETNATKLSLRQIWNSKISRRT